MRKIIQPLHLIFYILKKWKYVLPIFQKLTRIVKEQIILLLIPNKERHYQHQNTKINFFCVNCLHCHATKNKLKPHKKVSENKDFCGIVLLSPKHNILQFNQYMKSDKIPYIVYTDLEFFIKKLDGCADNPEKSSTIKMGEHIPW